MDTHVFLSSHREPLPVCTPEEAGISAASILRFIKKIEEEDLGLDSIQIVRNGKLCFELVAKPYHKDSFHRIYSAAKGIVATAILFMVQEGRITLESKVVPLLPAQWIPEDLDLRWDKLTVYHLLTMTTGHSRDTMFEMWKRDCWIRTFFDVKPDYEPGTYFLYDMGAQYVMNEIVANLTGQTTGEYLESRLFDVIGVDYTNNFTKPEGLFFSSTMQLHPDGLTRLALFYLNKGKWNGKQLLREDLAVLAGAHHGPSAGCTAEEPAQENAHGYALHMWRNREGGFRFDGGQGQFGIVLPDENMAVGILSCSNQANRILDVFFDTVFAESFNHPVELNALQAAKLKTISENFSHAPKYINASSEESVLVNGKRYALSENPFGQKAVTFRFGEDEVMISVETSDGTKVYHVGLKGSWLKNDADYLFSNKKPEDIADTDHNFCYYEKETLLSGGWRDTRTFCVTMRSDALLPEHRYEIAFFDRYVEIRMSPNAVYPRMGGPRVQAVYLYGETNN